MSEMPDYSVENGADAPAEAQDEPNTSTARRPNAHAARSLIEYLMRDAAERCSPLIIVVGDLDGFSLVQIRQQIEAGAEGDDRIVVPFSYRGATMTTILRELAERLRLNKKYSLAGAARLSASQAVPELFATRDEKVVLLVQEADRMPIDTYRHIATSLDALTTASVPGALFFLCVDEDFFDSQRGAILLQSLGSERIVSNVQFVRGDQKPVERRRVVPHPADVLTVTPGKDGLEDASPDMGDGVDQEEDTHVLDAESTVDEVQETPAGEARTWEDVASERSEDDANMLSVDGRSVLRKRSGWRRFFGG